MENTQGSTLAAPSSPMNMLAKDVEGSLSSELAAAQKEIINLHSQLDELESRLQPVVHSFDPTVSGLLPENSQEPIRTAVAGAAHDLVTGAASASSRVRRLINNLGL